MVYTLIINVVCHAHKQYHIISLCVRTSYVSKCVTVHVVCTLHDIVYFIAESIAFGSMVPGMVSSHICVLAKNIVIQ